MEFASNYVSIVNTSSATGITWDKDSRCVVTSSYDGHLRWWSIWNKDNVSYSAKITGDGKSTDNLRPVGAYVFKPIAKQKEERKLHAEGYDGDRYKDRNDDLMSFGEQITSSQGSHHAFPTVVTLLDAWNMCTGQGVPVNCFCCSKRIFPVPAYDQLATLQTAGRFRRRFNQKGSVVPYSGGGGGSGWSIRVYKQRRDAIKKDARETAASVLEEAADDAYLQTHYARKAADHNDTAQASNDMHTVSEHATAIRNIRDSMHAYRVRRAGLRDEAQEMSDQIKAKAGMVDYLCKTYVDPAEQCNQLVQTSNDVKAVEDEVSRIKSMLESLFSYSETRGIMIMKSQSMVDEMRSAADAAKNATLRRDWVVRADNENKMLNECYDIEECKRLAKSIESLHRNMISTIQNTPAYRDNKWRLLDYLDKGCMQDTDNKEPKLFELTVVCEGKPFIERRWAIKMPDDEVEDKNDPIFHKSMIEADSDMHITVSQPIMPVDCLATGMMARKKTINRVIDSNRTYNMTIAASKNMEELDKIWEDNKFLHAEVDKKDTSMYARLIRNVQENIKAGKKSANIALKQTDPDEIIDQSRLSSTCLEFVERDMEELAMYRKWMEEESHLKRSKDDIERNNLKIGTRYNEIAAILRTNDTENRRKLDAFLQKSRELHDSLQTNQNETNIFSVDTQLKKIVEDMDSLLKKERDRIRREEANRAEQIDRYKRDIQAKILYAGNIVDTCQKILKESGDSPEKRALFNQLTGITSKMNEMLGIATLENDIVKLKEMQSSVEDLRTEMYSIAEAMGLSEYRNGVQEAIRKEKEYLESGRKSATDILKSVISLNVLIFNKASKGKKGGGDPKESVDAMNIRSDLEKLWKVAKNQNEVGKMNETLTKMQALVSQLKEVASEAGVSDEDIESVFSRVENHDTGKQENGKDSQNGSADGKKQSNSTPQKASSSTSKTSKDTNMQSFPGYEPRERQVMHVPAGKNPWNAGFSSVGHRSKIEFAWEITFLCSSESILTFTLIREVGAEKKAVKQSSPFGSYPESSIVTGAYPGESASSSIATGLAAGGEAVKERCSNLRRYKFQFWSKSKRGVYNVFSTKRGQSLRYVHLMINTSSEIEPLKPSLPASVPGADYERVSAQNLELYGNELRPLKAENDTDILEYESDNEVPSFGEGIINYEVEGKFPFRCFKARKRFKDKTVPLEHVRRSHAGDRYAACSWNTRCIVYRKGDRNRVAELDPLSKGEDILLLRGHLGAVTHACWSPDDRYIATCSTDHTVRLWNSRTGKQILVILGHAGFVRAVEWSSDGNYIASGGDDKTVRIYNLMAWIQTKNSADIKVSKVIRANCPCLSLAWNPTNSLKLAVGWHKLPLEVWMPNQAGIEWKAIMRLDPMLKSVAYKEYDPDRKKMVDVHGMFPSYDVTHTHGLAWSPDGCNLAAAGGGMEAVNPATQRPAYVRYLSVWDVPSGRLKSVAENISMSQIWGVEWSPDGKKIAACTEDGIALVFNYAAMSTQRVDLNLFNRHSSTDPDVERSRRYHAMMREGGDPS